MISKCEVCLKPIKNRRTNSKYCSATCAGRAKRKRAEGKEEEDELNGFKPVYQENEQNQQNMRETAINELRTVEKDNFNTIMGLRSDYGDKIRALENENLKHEFTIEKLKDKISDLMQKHSKDIADANTSTTKETVQAITQMPAIQSALGALANNFMPGNSNALGGVEDGFSVQERQIIDAIRRMQPDAQAHLGQMLYVLFAKSHEEQMEIFTSLRAYMTQPDEQEEDI